MKTIKKMCLFAGGFIATDVFIKLISRQVYRSKAEKSFKELKEIDIFNNENNDSFKKQFSYMGKSIADMIRERKIIQLKSVIHANEQYDVVLFMDDFASMNFTTNEVFNWKVPSPKNYTERDIYIDFLGMHLLQLSRAGGAMSIYGGAGLSQRSAKSNKIFIIVDTHLKKFISDKEINSLIHHEYYHCMKQNGMMECIIGIRPLNEIKSNLSMIGLDPVEELEADEFAKINTGYSPQEFISEILEEYVPEVLRVSKLKGMYYRFNSWGFGR